MGSSAHHTRTIRRPFATRMTALLEGEHPVPEPTDEELRAYFDANRERWASEPRIDFVHVFVERKTRTPTPIPKGVRDALERLLGSP